MYRVILADPPWKFSTYSHKGKGRSAEAWYDCMTLSEIKALRPQIDAIADDDCVLFLWATDPFLKEAFSVIDAWGFIYKTVGFYWIKTGKSPFYIFPIGTGYWTRANPEQCLLATRGHPKRRDASIRKLIVARRREHSRKPDSVYPSIERLCSGPYIELFARQRQPGWDAWGLEANTGINRARRWSADARELK